METIQDIYGKRAIFIDVKGEEILIFFLTREDLSEINKNKYIRSVSSYDFAGNITQDGINRASLIIYSDGNEQKVLKSRRTVRGRLLNV